MRAVFRTVCIVLGIGVLLAVALSYFYKKGDGELPVYTTAITRMVQGEEIYRRDDHKAFTYPPFAAVPFIPFLGLPAELHNTLWFLVNISVFVYVFRRLYLLVGQWLPGDANRNQRRIFWTILLLLVARHLSSVFESKANDILLLLLMFELARLAASQRFSAVGALAGAGAAMKATPWLFLPILVWQRQLKAAAILFAVALAAHLIPDLIFPRNDGNSWTLSWYSTFLSGLTVDSPPDADGAWAAWNQLNQSLAATIYRLSTPFDPGGSHPYNVNPWLLEGMALSLLTIVAQLAVLVAVMLATRPDRSRRHQADTSNLRLFGQAGAVFCGMLLLSPMSSKSHFGVLIVPLTYCVMELIRDPRRAVIGAHLGLVFVIGTLTTKDFIGKELGNQVLALGSVTWCTVLTLSASVYGLSRQAFIGGQYNPQFQPHPGNPDRP